MCLSGRGRAKERYNITAARKPAESQNRSRVRGLVILGDAMNMRHPLTGGGILLPLDPKNNYTAEILICGGSEFNSAAIPSSTPYNSCGRIKPLLPNPTWEQDTMNCGDG